MTSLRIAAVSILLFGPAVAADAQMRPAPPQPEPNYVNVAMLPVSLARIQQQLRQSTTTEERDGLNLRYQVDVFGRAPEIRIFTPEDNLTTGPVPYGAPTHREIIDHITPQEYRSPVMDFSALMKWLAEKSRK